MPITLPFQESVHVFNCSDPIKCKALSTLSPKMASVAENGDSRTLLQLSPKSATEWTGFKDRLRISKLLWI